MCHVTECRISVINPDWLVNQMLFSEMIFIVQNLSNEVLLFLFKRLWKVLPMCPVFL